MFTLQWAGTDFFSSSLLSMFVWQKMLIIRFIFLIVAILIAPFNVVQQPHRSLSAQIFSHWEILHFPQTIQIWAESHKSIFLLNHKLFLATVWIKSKNLHCFEVHETPVHCLITNVLWWRANISCWNFNRQLITFIVTSLVLVQ